MTASNSCESTVSEVSDCEPNGMLKEKTAPAECGLCPLPLDADDEEAALDREEEGVSPPVVSMTRCGTGGGRVYFTSCVSDWNGSMRQCCCCTTVGDTDSSTNNSLGQAESRTLYNGSSRRKFHTDHQKAMANVFMRQSLALQGKAVYLL